MGQVFWKYLTVEYGAGESESLDWKVDTWSYIYRDWNGAVYVENNLWKERMKGWKWKWALSKWWVRIGFIRFMYLLLTSRHQLPTLYYFRIIGKINNLHHIKVVSPGISVTTSIKAFFFFSFKLYLSPNQAFS